MRKAIVIATLVGAWILVAATPALAQRDPFAPVIDPNAATTTTTTTTGSTGTAPFDDQSSVDSGGLSNTGSDVSPLLVIAYGLLVLGGTAVMLARLHAPTPLRR